MQFFLRVIKKVPSVLVNVVLTLATLWILVICRIFITLDPPSLGKEEERWRG